MNKGSILKKIDENELTLEMCLLGNTKMEDIFTPGRQV